MDAITAVLAAILVTFAATPSSEAIVGGTFGVVILAAPVVGVVPATVVGAGQLIALAKGSAMTLVGYGAEREFEPPRKPTFVYNVLRMTTTAGLKSLTPNVVLLNGNPKNNLDGGGLCSGDSGGPVFSGSLLVAVNSFAQTNCQNVSGSVRLDTPLARAFLDDYVALPL